MQSVADWIFLCSQSHCINIEQLYLTQKKLRVFFIVNTNIFKLTATGSLQFSTHETFLYETSIMKVMNWKPQKLIYLLTPQKSTELKMNKKLFLVFSSSKLVYQE